MEINYLNNNNIISDFAHHKSNLLLTPNINQSSKVNNLSTISSSNVSIGDAFNKFNINKSSSVRFKFDNISHSSKNIIDLNHINSDYYINYNDNNNYKFNIK